MNYKDRVDPELKKMAKPMPFNRRIVAMGNVYQAAALKLVKIPKDILVSSIETEGYQSLPFRTEVFTPAGIEGPMPSLICVHGGAFCYKAAVYHKKLAFIYASKAKCKVFFPDYHLAPKYPYPAALCDVRSLYEFVSDHAEELGVDRSRIGLAGDSAGATIASMICSGYGKEGFVKPCFLMLVYPMTDADMETQSMKMYKDAPFWNSENHRKMWEISFGEQYSEVLKNGIIETLPMYCIPPAGIPDTYIETAEFDCLHDEGILYGRRLEEAGANVEFNETKGTFHGYDMALDTQIVRDAVKKRLSFMKRHF